MGGPVEDTLSLARPAATRAGGPAARALAAYLTVVLDVNDLAAPSRRFALAGLDELRLGRGPAGAAVFARSPGRAVLEVSLPDRWASQQHARLCRMLDRWQLEDGGSKNGTRLGGRVCARGLLADGDVVEVGGTLLVYREDEGGPADADAPAILAADEDDPLATLAPAFARELRRLRGYAATTLPVLLLGETGTGKEVAARALHQASRRAGAFVPVNCGALPTALVESELFGYRRGAFSGAADDRPGLVRAADHGTLLLDELVELPREAQVKLLRVLQEKEVWPLGATRAVPVDLRVVAATHGDPATAVARGAFRQDLLSRVAGGEVHLPPLRRRREDLGTLVRRVLRAAGVDPGAVYLDLEAARGLCTAQWPGNIRELERAIAAALATARDGRIGAADLRVRTEGPGGGREQAAGGGEPVDEGERARLERLCAVHRGNVSAMARALVTSRTQVQRLLVRHGLRAADYR